MHHRLQHLCGCDHRYTGVDATTDDGFLNQGNLFCRHLHPQVPPGDHDGAGLADDVGKVLYRLRLLDLADDGNGPAVHRFHVSLQGTHIIPAADEGKGHIIESVGKSKGKIGFILLGEGTQMLQRNLGQVHSLAGQQGPLFQHPAMDVTPINMLHHQAYQTIVDENPLADENLLMQVRIVYADAPPISHTRLGGDYQLFPPLEGIGGLFQLT